MLPSHPSRNHRTISTTLAAPRRVLLVDDEEMLRRAYARILRAAGFLVEEACDFSAAMHALAERTFDVVISDISMPEADGIDILRAARKKDPSLPVVLVTGRADMRTAVEAVEHGAMRYLIKPLERDVLCRAAEEGVRQREQALAATK